MTDRLPNYATGSPSEIGETQDNNFIVDIPLTALRNWSSAPGQAGETGSSVPRPLTEPVQRSEWWVEANGVGSFWNQGPVAIDVVTNTNTQYIEWKISDGSLPKGLFELVLGISSQDLDLNAVDSITFDYVCETNQAPRRPSEVIPNTTLRNLFATLPAGDSVLRWKLYERIATDSGAGGAIKIIMTIETWKDVSLNPGAIRLHFLELQQDSLMVYRDDPSCKKHYPFTWCIDVNVATDRPSKGAAKEIISYHFSGDGAYVALQTLSATGQHLDVYRIDQDRPSSPLVASWALSPYSATVFDISISWNATQIVALDLTGQDFTAIYARQHSKYGIQDFATTAPGLSEEQYIAEELHRDLRRYGGRGTFYVSGSLERILKDEHFVAFDGMTLVIYSVCGRWEEVTAITIGGPTNSIDLYPYWKQHMRGDYLVLLNRERAYVSMWNIREKCSVPAMDIPIAASDNPYIVACLSECGWLFVMATRRHIDVYLTETWTRLGSWYLPVTKQMDISDVYFTGESEYITVHTSSDLAPVIHSQGYVVDINTMITVNQIYSRNLQPHSFFALDSVNRPAPILLYQTQTTLGAIPYTDRVVRSISKAATLCTDGCKSSLFSQPPSPLIFQAEVVDRAVGPRDRPKTLRFISITARIPADVAAEAMSMSLPKGSEMLSLRRTLVDDHYFLVVAMSSLVLVWRFPATLDGEYELLLAMGITTDADWKVCQHHQLHRHDRTNKIVTKINLLDPRVLDLAAFLDGIVQLSRIFKDADDKSKRGIIRHVERHINHGLDPKDNSATVLNRLCSSWSPECHEHLLAFIRALFGSASFRWIPPTGMSRETNPISILLSHLSTNVVVADIVEIMISYCVHQAKADNDLRFLDPVFLSLRAAVKSKYITPGLLSKAMRTFAYFPARDYRFAMDHHAFALRIFKSSDQKKMLHEQKHPTVYLTSKNIRRTSNERLTPHLYVASFDMLWVIEEIPLPRQRALAILLRILLFVTLTSRKRYVCHPFSLKDLDNPALASLIRIVFYSYIAWFYVALILSNLLSDKEDEGSMEKIYNVNVCLSWLFALGSARDLVILMCLKMKPRDFAYKIVEILVAFMPSIALMAIAFSFDLELYYFVTALSILILLLQLLFEFRVMKTVGSFLSVLWRALRSVKILIAVFAYILIAYGVVFYYLQYLACEDDKCPKLPDNNSAAFVSITMTYFMTGGYYGLVDDKVKTGDWILNVIMVTFLFTVTIMLNILFGMVNHAFGNHDHTSELEWMEDRMVFVMRAENLFRWIPYIRNNAAWFPEKIYYTATPQQVRDYRLESQRLAKYAAAAALPLEDDTQDKTPMLDEAAENTVTTEQQALGRQQPWLDQLREDMRAEFKEELREQLEAQTEQIAQLQAQLSEILAVLRRDSRH
ncbi:hypothetical protein K457DRAFT_121478 [Linnemannia elongata AG-77]|uniref:Ion transport domain-containing protein n=1 Tax=Linnemannia elongata AG-77 TaxID=1314771 RepID=A0A197KET5_9FUNG|nr:hypothetical protein K457DRAFT_121478 [Linnemannia elongata AG-77]